MVMHQKLKEPSNELVIKSVYALAITRFLNTAASFSKDRVPKTLYKIAESLNIPEWIVNIRHEAAHSPDLPSLDVLQAGVQFSLQWLRSIYWEKGLEEDPPEKDVVFEYNLRDELEKWCEIFQEVYLQKLINNPSDNNIRDPMLMKKVNEYLWGDDGSISSDEDLETSGAKATTISALLNKLVMRLNSVYDMAMRNKYKVEKVLKCFLEVSEFLSCKKKLQKYTTSEREKADQGITWHMRNMWTRVIKDFIQNHGILLQFMNELVNYNSGDMVKDLFASYWIRDIARGILLAQVALQVEKSDGANFRQTKYYTKDQETEIYQKTKGLFRNFAWENAMILSLNNIPMTDDLVKEILMFPKKHTRIYIDDLIATTKRKLSQSKKRKIMKFMDLILNQKCYAGGGSSLNEKIYVMNKAGNECNVAEEQLETTDSGSNPVWRQVPFGFVPSLDD